MQMVCSPQGLLEPRHPRQGVLDMLAAGLGQGILDISLFCPLRLVNKFGWDMPRLRRWLSEAEEMVKIASEHELKLPLAQAPFWPAERAIRGKAELDETALRGLTEDAMRLAAKAGSQAIIVQPVSKDCYLSLAPLAQELGLKILLSNGLRDVGGHLLRGLCADPSEAVAWVDELNGMTGGGVFGFALDMEAANLCGQDVQALILALGVRLQAAVVSDTGAEGAAYLPFLGVGRHRGLRTDWLGFLRGLRAIAFDGWLALNFRDTAAALPPLLKPAFLPFVKKTADYLVWQIELEKPLREYPAVVLFGAGNMCQNYMSCYGEKYPPLFTCDNNPKRWGEIFAGLEVRSPEALREITPETVILICNVYYREIEAQLREMQLVNPIAYFNDEYMPSFAPERIDWREMGE